MACTGPGFAAQKSAAHSFLIALVSWCLMASIAAPVKAGVISSISSIRDRSAMATVTLLLPGQ